MRPLESISVRPCSVCLVEGCRPAFDINGYLVFRCSQCGHLFVAADLAPAELENAYGKAYYETRGAGTVGYEDYLRDADLRTRGFKDRLRQIEARVGTPGRLLDYGCAVGLMVKAALEEGWDAVGYERSEWAAQYGRERFGVDIVLGQGWRVPKFENRFDVVTMWDVVEHLEHPRTVLELVHGWLKPGGLLALNTVNSSSLGARLAGQHWRHLVPPHHLQFFSRASLRRLLNDCGFALLSQQGQGVMLTAHRNKSSMNGIAGWTERLTTHWRTKRLATALNLLDEIEMVAVRR